MARGKTKAYKEQSFDNLRGLDGISDDQISEHLQLYAGYVKQVNSLNQELAELMGKGKASGKDPAFAELTRRLGFEYNGMILHEYYFSNLRKAGEPTPRHRIGRGAGARGAVRLGRAPGRPTSRRWATCGGSAGSSCFRTRRPTA